MKAVFIRASISSQSRLRRLKYILCLAVLSAFATLFAADGGGFAFAIGALVTCSALIAACATVLQASFSFVQKYPRG